MPRALPLPRRTWRWVYLVLRPLTSPWPQWHGEMPRCGLHSIGTHSCGWLVGVSVTGMPWFAIAQFASRFQPSLLILARDSPGSLEEEPHWTLLCSEMGTMPHAQPSHLQEQQVLTEAGTGLLTQQGASHQPGTTAASNQPSSKVGCRVCLFPPQARTSDVRNRASGMLFPEERGRRFCRQQGSTPRHVSSSPQSASQQC